MSELFHLSGFGFTYPQQRTPALTDVELTIRSGEFWVLCGPSGCGKSTLLRQLKTVLAPHGITEGEVYFQGTPLREIPLRQQAADNFVSRVGSHNAERRGKGRHNGYGNDNRVNKIADNTEAHAQRSNNKGKFANLRQAETAQN